MAHEVFKKTPLISIVLPVFNEEAGIEETIDVLLHYVAARQERYELIFVDDGSRDNSVKIIREAMRRAPQIKLVEFSRNFGHQLAITAGVRYASGDAVVVMDADLQDPPSVIPAMIAKWQAGYAVVYGKRRHRDGESWFKKASAAAFYRILHSITNVNMPVDTGDFRLMDRQVVDVLDQMNEPDPFVRGMVSWIGFKQTGVLYDRKERYAGTSKYPLRKMLGLAMNGITSFSRLPLILGYWAAGVLGVSSILVLLGNLLRGTLTAETWVIITVALTGALILLALGAMGTYVGRMFTASRERPLYIVAKTEGFQQAQVHTHPQTQKEDSNLVQLRN
ncbi:glycosyltransferase family 2 protein [Schleiferilactobacillus shenzhenensis]|nr:glycosyltransferase family 2 protein [Schleiferilactobacillus shenzhenensis]